MRADDFINAKCTRCGVDNNTGFVFVDGVGWRCTSCETEFYKWATGGYNKPKVDGGVAPKGRKKERDDRQQSF